MYFADPWEKQDSRQQPTSPSPNSTTTDASESTLISDGAPSSASRGRDTTTYTAATAGPFGSLEFEDNFDPHPPLNPREPQDNRLPDSDNYLAALGKHPSSNETDFSRTPLRGW